MLIVTCLDCVIRHNLVKLFYRQKKEDIRTMIGIIGAMEEEVAALKEVMELQETVEQASMIF